MRNPGDRGGFARSPWRAAVAALLVAACTGDDGDAVATAADPSPSSSPSTSLSTSPVPSPPPGDLAPPPPLVGDLPSAAFGGGGLVLYGGMDDVFHPVGGAARYDVATATWSELPEPPVDPLNHPRAIWTGTRVLLAGSPCAEVDDTNDTELGCSPGGMAFLALDAEAGSWERLDPAPNHTEEDPLASDLQVVGAIDDVAVVIVDGQWWRLDLSVDGGGWSELASPPGDDDDRCTGPAGVLSVSYHDLSHDSDDPPVVGEGSGPFGPGVDDDRPAEPPAVATLDLDSGEWETSESPIVLAVAGTAPDDVGVVCTAEGVALAATTFEGTGSTLLYDAAARAWGEGDPPPTGPANFFVAGTAPVAGGTVVFIDGSYVLLGGDGRWSEPQPLLGAIPSDVLSDGTVAIALVRSGGGDPPARVTVVVG